MNLVSRSSFVAAALVASVFAAGPTAAQEIKGKLVLYTSQPERDASQTVAAFKRVQPGVDVEVFRSGTTEVMGKLAAEFAGGQPRADVLLLADAATMEALEKDSRLLNYRAGEGRGPRSRHLRCGQDLFRLEADHDRNRGEHRGEAPSHLVGGSGEARVQGPDRDAEPAVFRRGGDHAGHDDQSSRSRLGIFRKAEGCRRGRGARQRRGDDRGRERRESRTASWSISWRSTPRPRARRSISSFPSEGLPAVTEPVAILKTTQNAAAARGVRRFHPVR